MNMLTTGPGSDGPPPTMVKVPYTIRGRGGTMQPWDAGGSSQPCIFAPLPCGSGVAVLENPLKSIEIYKILEIQRNPLKSTEIRQNPLKSVEIQ